jgi:hypothetical protein
MAPHARDQHRNLPLRLHQLGAHGPRHRALVSRSPPLLNTLPSLTFHHQQNNMSQQRHEPERHLHDCDAGRRREGPVLRHYECEDDEEDGVCACGDDAADAGHCF